MDLHGERIYLWTILAEKVAAAAKLVCFTRWLEFIHSVLREVEKMGYKKFFTHTHIG